MGVCEEPVNVDFNIARHYNILRRASQHQADQGRKNERQYAYFSTKPPNRPDSDNKTWKPPYKNVKRIDFTPIDGLKGQHTDGIPPLLTLSGHKEAIEKAKKRLTAYNKSIIWQTNRLKKTRKTWLDKPDSAFRERRLEELSLQIAELEAQQSERFYSENEDGTISTLPGFWFLCSDLDGKHINYVIKPITIPGLRQYQKDMVDALLKYNRATGVLGTGGGKTMVIAALCRAASLSGRRTLVVVPTIYLVNQTYETIKKFHESVTKAGGNNRPALGSDVLITTADSALGYVGSYHNIIIDESQHSPATTWTQILSAAEQATNVYNLTATPFRADGMDIAIHSFGGPVVFERDVKWLIDNDWLVKPTFYTAKINVRDERGRLRFFSDRTVSASAYKKLVISNEVMNLITTLLDRMLPANKKVMVLFKTIAPGLELMKRRPDIVKGVASSSNIKPLILFRKGESNLLVSNDKLVGEGVDIPGCDVLIMVTQHSSTVMTYQMIGRCLRKSENKEKAIIIDISVNGYEQFERAAEIRKKTYRYISGGIEPTVLRV